MNTTLQQPVRISETAAWEHGYRKAYSQEKLDGVRAVWNGKELLTRNGKAIRSCGHIVEQLQAHGITEPLDGEIYVRGLELGDISGAARSKTPQVHLEFHVFDIAGEGTFEQRLERVKALPAMSAVKIVPTYAEAEMPPAKLFADVVSHGGEGIIIRDGDSHYEAGYAPCAALKVKPDYIAELPNGNRWDLV